MQINEQAQQSFEFNGKKIGVPGWPAARPRWAPTEGRPYRLGHHSICDSLEHLRRIKQQRKKLSAHFLAGGNRRNAFKRGRV